MSACLKRFYFSLVLLTILILPTVMLLTFIEFAVTLVIPKSAQQRFATRHYNLLFAEINSNNNNNC